MRLTGGGSSITGAGGSHSLGGHPLKSADQSKKQDIKHRFEITKKLGSGTYGKVSLAFDHKTDREVAVKLIKKSAIENKADLVRIRREIRIMSALQHPNIIQIYEVFENKDKIILVMEYASGGELYDYVSKNSSLQEHEARRIFRQITSAVLYCHKHKVAHRDLKLENILLDVDNNAKIADFGLSNYFEDKRLLSTFCGSPLYASPEIINGTPYKGPEVDCWSLGILLYTLVYGSMPFDGRDFNRMVRQIKRGAYYEPDTPSTASMLIRNMLRVNPDRRADIDDIASHWWLNLEENMPVIQELPENQITDHTPLTEREETMVVQDLADETDVFMEFGHLSSDTRKKIEEFRRRRKEAEEYNENSPIKPPKARKLNSQPDEPEMTSKEKSLRETEEVIISPLATEQEKPPEPIIVEETDKNPIVNLDDLNDPLERLRQLENRLNTNRSKGSPEKNRRESRFEKRKVSITNPDIPPTPSSANQAPGFMSVTEALEKKSSTSTVASSSINSRTTQNSRPGTSRQREWTNQETDSLNMLMNQVLEQMEKGPVSLNTVARIKAHPHYDQRPMVKELLESIIAAQPAAVQKQASKIIQQQSQDIIRKQISGNTMSSSGHKNRDRSKEVLNEYVSSSGKKTNAAPLPAETSMVPNRPKMFDEPEKETVHVRNGSVQMSDKSQHKLGNNERPWHSVEVGFESEDDEDASEYEEEEISEIEKMDDTVHNKSMIESAITEVTVQDTSFEDVTDDETQASENTLHTDKTPEPKKQPTDMMEVDKEKTSELESEEETDEECEEEEEVYDSEIEELADVVEQTVSSSTEKEKDSTVNVRSIIKETQPIETKAPSISIAIPTSPPYNGISNANVNVAQQQSGPTVIDPNLQLKEGHYLNTFDRGLIKRQSKGKYQLNHVDLYGRGVSAETDIPPQQHNKRRIGGPQPPLEQSPFLFDKAKKYIMQYPDKLGDSDDERLNEKLVREKRQQSIKAQWLAPHKDQEIVAKQRNCSLPPRQLHPEKCSDDGSDYDNGSSKHKKMVSESEEEEEDEEEEESDAEVVTKNYKGAVNIIGFRTVQNGVTKETPVVSVNSEQSQVNAYKSLATNKKTISPTQANQQQPTSSHQIAYSSQAQSFKAEKQPETHQKSPNTVPRNVNNYVPNSQKDSDITSPKPFVTKSASPSFSGNVQNSNKDASPPFVEDYSGMQKWETAAGYIRRKNRERRQRNQTIAITEEAYLRAKYSFGGGGVIDSTTEESVSNSPSHENVPTLHGGCHPNTDYSILTPETQLRYGLGNLNLSDKSKTQTTGVYPSPQGFGGSSNYGGNVSPYSARRNDDYHYSGAGKDNYGNNSLYQYRDLYRPNITVDRRKSFHEITPEKDYETDQFGSNFGFDKYRYNANSPYQSTNIRPREEDYSSSSYNSVEPRRYQAYQTRSEKEAEARVNATYGGVNLRPTTANWLHNNTLSSYNTNHERDRPVSSYNSSPYKPAGRAEDAYNFPRRSAYEPSTTSNSYDYNNGSFAASHQNTANGSSGYGSNNLKEDSTERTTKESIFSRIRPVTRRVVSALRDSDKKARARSQSTDRKLSDSVSNGSEAYNFEIGKKLATPEINDRINDYTYINYYDSSGAMPRSSQPKDPDLSMAPSRGILKNKQTSELEQRTKDVTNSSNGPASASLLFAVFKIFH
uniref:Protein kinase domain-containing protein n=1 Tax=Rhabditophanes sp. KR3021 TaxID=114890 RepID=A0AC35U8B5_9BILA